MTFKYQKELVSDYPPFFRGEMTQYIPPDNRKYAGLGSDSNVKFFIRMSVLFTLMKNFIYGI
jgi:hypothetical protein